MTHDTTEIEEISKKWQELGINKCLSQMIDYHHQQLQKARESEREQFLTILSKLYEAGDSRKEMTMKYWQRIKSKSELDQDKK